MDSVTQLSYYQTVAPINEAHKVYLVKHEITHRMYVKKVLDIYNKSVYEFLSHSNFAGIPRIVEIYEENHQLTVIEEYIPGETLETYIQQHRLTRDRIMEIMRELCRILAPLHKSKPPVIHRDIKPSNIILVSAHHICLIDFNAAKQVHDPTANDTVLLGTKGYAAPEQYGFGSSNAQTDIYSMGILLREMVQSLDNPTNQFDRVIKHCTKMDPAERYHSVTELLHDLPNTYVPNWSKFFPPGFRSGKIQNMAVSLCGFGFWTFFCTWIQFEGEQSVATLHTYRLIIFLMGITVILFNSNYLNVRSLVPLTLHKKRSVRILSIIAFDMIIVLAWLIFLAIVTS